jgi:hypothetical protein
MTERKRGNGNHLKYNEIEKLRRAFNEGVRTDDAAAMVNCSTRIATKYYARFRGGTPFKVGRPKISASGPAKRPPLPSRFYQGNFELT